jgi:C4-type Zn-finger protein
MGENVALTYDVPDDQVIRYKIVPEKGALMTMETIGRQLTLLSKILCWESDKDEPRKWKAMLQCINTHADGSIEFTIIVATKSPSIPLQEQQP